MLNASANKIDRMNVLQSLHYFSSWPQLKSYFQNKVEKLYDSIIEEITVAKEWITYNEHQIYALMPKYSGVCLLFTARFKRITMLKNVNSKAKYCVYVQAFHAILNNSYNSKRTHLDVLDFLKRNSPILPI